MKRTKKDCERDGGGGVGGGEEEEGGGSGGDEKRRWVNGFTQYRNFFCLLLSLMSDPL